MGLGLHISREHQGEIGKIMAAYNAVKHEVMMSLMEHNEDASPDDFPDVDIAVDPLEGTNLCALGANNAIAVLAASERGGLLNAPDIYMDKIVVGPSSRGAIDIDAPVKDNLKAIARRLSRDIEDLTVIVLDRSRHKKLINDVREAGGDPAFFREHVGERERAKAAASARQELPARRDVDDVRCSLLHVVEPSRCHRVRGPERAALRAREIGISCDRRTRSS